MANGYTYQMSVFRILVFALLIIVGCSSVTSGWKQGHVSGKKYFPPVPEHGGYGELYRLSLRADGNMLYLVFVTAEEYDKWSIGDRAEVYVGDGCSNVGHNIRDVDEGGVFG